VATVASVSTDRVELRVPRRNLQQLSPLADEFNAEFSTKKTGERSKKLRRYNAALVFGRRERERDFQRRREVLYSLLDLRQES
jgi:hypothetical protein